MSLDRVDEELPQQSYAKAIFSVQIVVVQFNLNGLPDHLFHISGLGGQDAGVLKLNVVAHFDAVLSHRCLGAPDGCGTNEKLQPTLGMQTSHLA
jgi:hypothetical protein